jgi:hypothetical protein
MGPMGVVVSLVLGEERHQMSAARHQGEVQQLVPDCSDEPLGEGVGLWSADRRQDHPGILSSEHLVERACELGVAVTDQEPDVIQSAFDREVARLLGDPQAIRVRGHPDDPDPPCPDLDQEQHVERA